MDRLIGIPESDFEPDFEHVRAVRRIRPREEGSESPKRAKVDICRPEEAYSLGSTRKGELLLRESKRVKIKKTYPSDTEYGFCSYIV
jgi:hypothetical protein